MYNVTTDSLYSARSRKAIPSITFAVLVLAFASAAHASETLFYTGDPNNLEAIGDYNNPLGGPLPLSQIFEPFTVTAPGGWDIDSVYFNELDLASDPITSAEWSISTGMAPGISGVTIASGSGSASGIFGSDTITVSGLNVLLGPGNYWLNITPDSTTGRLFADSTSGLNSFDANLGGAALWYEPGVQNYSATNYDFSAGATGEAAPEPGTLWLMLVTCAIGGIVLASNRARRVN